MENVRFKTEHDEIEIKTEPIDDGEEIKANVGNVNQFDPNIETDLKAELPCISGNTIQNAVKSEIDIYPTNLEEARQLHEFKETCDEPITVTGGGSKKILKIVYGVKSKDDVDPHLIVDSPRRKLYDMERLREFGDVPFVIKRMEPQDLTITYSKAVRSVETILELLRRNHVPNGIGIAFRIANHTPSSCILTLA